MLFRELVVINQRYVRSITQTKSAKLLVKTANTLRRC